MEHRSKWGECGEYASLLNSGREKRIEEGVGRDLTRGRVMEKRREVWGCREKYAK